MRTINGSQREADGRFAIVQFNMGLNSSDAWFINMVARNVVKVVGFNPTLINKLTVKIGCQSDGLFSFDELIRDELAKSHIHSAKSGGS